MYTAWAGSGPRCFCPSQMYVWIFCPYHLTVWWLHTEAVLSYQITCLMHWENMYSISFQIEWDMVVVTAFFSILNQMEFHLVQNRKENCHHDHIPFNLKGNRIRVSSVQCRTEFHYSCSLTSKQLVFQHKDLFPPFCL